MVAQEFRHDSNRRFAADDDHENDDDFGEIDDIVIEGKGFTESTSSELLFRKVKSDEEACELYNSYAFKYEFGAHKGDKKTRNDKKVRQRFLTCSYAGFKKIKNEDVLYQKKDFRTGCKAYIQFDVNKEFGLYIMVKHEMEYYHSRVPISKRHLIRSHRKVSGDQLAMITSCSENGILIADAYRVIRDQVVKPILVFFKEIFMLR